MSTRTQKTPKQTQEALKKCKQDPRRIEQKCEGESEENCKDSICQTFKSTTNKKVRGRPHHNTALSIIFHPHATRNKPGCQASTWQRLIRFKRWWMNLSISEEIYAKGSTESQKTGIRWNQPCFHSFPILIASSWLFPSLCLCLCLCLSLPLCFLLYSIPYPIVYSLFYILF